jgi:hypothetical protein
MQPVLTPEVEPSFLTEASGPSVALQHCSELVTGTGYVLWFRQSPGWNNVWPIESLKPMKNGARC